jgi:hypothetical protein
MEMPEDHSDDDDPGLAELVAKRTETPPGRPTDLPVQAALERIAAQLEKDAPWKDRRPQVWG